MSGLGDVEGPLRFLRRSLLGTAGVDEEEDVRRGSNAPRMRRRRDGLERWRSAMAVSKRTGWMWWREEEKENQTS